MKIPKALLGAIVIGIAVQATSCSKDKEISEPKAKKEAEKKETYPLPYNCPACGMG